MTYNEAKEALTKSGVTAESKNVFLLDAYVKNGFAWSTFIIDTPLITKEDQWADTYSLMKENGNNNEHALKQLGLIDSQDLDVLLFSNIDQPERKYVTLKYYLDQQPAQ